MAELCDSRQSSICKFLGITFSGHYLADFLSFRLASCGHSLGSQQANLQAFLASIFGSFISCGPIPFQRPPLMLVQLSANVCQAIWEMSGQIAKKRPAKGPKLANIAINACPTRLISLANNRTDVCHRGGVEPRKSDIQVWKDLRYKGHIIILLSY